MNVGDVLNMVPQEYVVSLDKLRRLRKEMQDDVGFG